MIRSILLFCLLAVSGAVAAASSDPIYDIEVDLDDEASLQNGARLFVNYCMSCHSAKHMRYNRLGKDLGIPESVLEKNLMFGTDKVGSTMDNAMPAEEAEQWFGVAPPDLTLIARSRGPDWLYSYLTTFYRDPESSTGFNNWQFKGVAMPHVLWQLQGIKRPVYDDHGHIKELETAVRGSMTDEEFHSAMHDLVSFMVYLAEPAKMQRYTIGAWVMFYLVILLVVVYLLKKEFWRDIH